MTQTTNGAGTTAGPLSTPEFEDFVGGKVLTKILHTICPDAKRRTAFITGAPTTFFSAPCRVNVKHNTVAGVVSFNHEDKEYHFHPNKAGRNARLFQG